MAKKTKKTVIIIDDDVDILQATKLTLEHGGYAVETACSGKEGVDRIRRGGIDLIILDVMMARPTEGFHIAQELKADGASKAIPTLMTTSVSAKTGFKFDPKTDGEYLPVEDFVEKPVDPQDLLARVKRLLAQ